MSRVGMIDRLLLSTLYCKEAYHSVYIIYTYVCMVFLSVDHQSTLAGKAHTQTLLCC